ncbi:hypothetical protein ACHWQZ_G017842 [Mnemiopsis leidyi]
MIFSTALLLWVAANFSKTSGLTSEELRQFKVGVGKDTPYTVSGPSVKVSEEEGGVQVIQFNTIPDHYIGQWDGQNDAFPQIKAKVFQLKIRKYPIRAHNTLWCLPFGIIGVTIKGVPIYNPYVPEKGCKYAVNHTYLDACRGRVDRYGVYHYYDYSLCVRSFECGAASELFGVAIDGYPIYGPTDEFGQILTGKDLDECGGRVDGYGKYKYHITMDQPNFMYCLKGQIHPEFAETFDTNNFVCNCPYTDSHFTEPPMRCEVLNDTEGATVAPGNFIKVADCMSQKQLKQKYTETRWGEYNISKDARVCNFTNPQNTVICDIDPDLWEKRPSWEYRTKEVNTLPCCPKDAAVFCGESCFVDRMVSKDNVSPHCKMEKMTVIQKVRVMVPNSARRRGDALMICGGILLTILGTLLYH